jgi:hypothetical protein
VGDEPALDRGGFDRLLQLFEGAHLDLPELPQRQPGLNLPQRACCRRPAACLQPSWPEAAA